MAGKWFFWEDGLAVKKGDLFARIWDVFRTEVIKGIFLYFRKYNLAKSFSFGGILGSASRAKFPISLSNHIGFMPCLTTAHTTPQKVLSIWRLVELKMLDFSDCAWTAFSILTSATETVIIVIHYCHWSLSGQYYGPYLRLQSFSKILIWIFVVKAENHQIIKAVVPIGILNTCLKTQYGRLIERLESVRIGKCQNPFLCQIGKCQNWKVSELESVRIGKCQNRKVSESESVRIGKCQNC